MLLLFSLGLLGLLLLLLALGLFSLLLLLFALRLLSLLLLLAFGLFCLLLLLALGLLRLLLLLFALRLLGLFLLLLLRPILLLCLALATLRLGLSAALLLTRRRLPLAGSHLLVALTGGLHPLLILTARGLGKGNPAHARKERKCGNCADCFDDHFTPPVPVPSTRRRMLRD